MSVALASRTRRLGVQQPGCYYQAEGRAGVALRLQRHVCVCTSRDEADPTTTAIAQVAARRWEDFDTERAAHEAAWGVFWAAAEPRTVGKPCHHAGPAFQRPSPAHRRRARLAGVGRRARACPMCGAAERGLITDVRLFHGRVVDGLQQLLDEKHAELMVVGWRGQFLIGHAQVLKTLMKSARCAVLLVKPPEKAPFRLKVGDAFG